MRIILKVRLAEAVVGLDLDGDAGALIRRWFVILASAATLSALVEEQLAARLNLAINDMVARALFNFGVTRTLDSLPLRLCAEIREVVGQVALDENLARELRTDLQVGLMEEGLREIGDFLNATSTERSSLYAQLSQFAQGALWPTRWHSGVAVLCDVPTEKWWSPDVSPQMDFPDRLSKRGVSDADMDAFLQLVDTLRGDGGRRVCCEALHAQGWTSGLIQQLAMATNFVDLTGVGMVRFGIPLISMMPRNPLWADSTRSAADALLRTTDTTGEGKSYYALGRATATRLGDEVLLRAQDLTLLQFFSHPRDSVREADASRRLASAIESLHSLQEDFSSLCADYSADEDTLRTVDVISAETETAWKVSDFQKNCSKYLTTAGEVNSAQQALLDLYGKLPGEPDTPEFFLQLLAWRRSGFPKLRAPDDGRPLT